MPVACKKPLRSSNFEGRRKTVEKCTARSEVGLGPRSTGNETKGDGRRKRRQFRRSQPPRGANHGIRSISVHAAGSGREEEEEGKDGEEEEEEEEEEEKEAHFSYWQPHRRPPLTTPPGHHHNSGAAARDILTTREPPLETSSQLGSRHAGPDGPPPPAEPAVAGSAPGPNAGPPGYGQGVLFSVYRRRGHIHAKRYGRIACPGLAWVSVYVFDGPGPGEARRTCRLHGAPSLPPSLPPPSSWNSSFSSSSFPSPLQGAKNVT